MDENDSTQEKPVPNEHLKRARLARGWTHKDVADRLKLPDIRQVSRWERGVNIPHPHYRQALSDLFGKSQEDLGLSAQAALLESASQGNHRAIYSIGYYTCFISYSNRDQNFAERLYIDLLKKGVRCWYAPEDMDIGDEIRSRIDETIRLHDKLLLVLSEHSVTSSWVAYEVKKALNKEPQGIPNVLYPIRLDDAVMHCQEHWVEEIRGTRHIGDFTKWKEHDAYQNALDQLLRALKPKSQGEETRL